MKQSLQLVPASDTTLLTLGTAISFAPSSFAQEWKPDRPINLIVPWGTGGGRARRA